MERFPRGTALSPLALQDRDPQPVASNTKCGAWGEERPVLGHGGPGEPAGRPAAGGSRDTPQQGCDVCVLMESTGAILLLLKSSSSLADS